MWGRVFLLFDYTVRGHSCNKIKLKFFGRKFHKNYILRPKSAYKWQNYISLKLNVCSEGAAPQAADKQKTAICDKRKPPFRAVVNS